MAIKKKDKDRGSQKQSIEGSAKARLKCSVTGKKSFQNRKTAASRAKQTANVFGTEYDYYKCRHCSFYHLTTKRA